jgi:hypothetical protein
MSPKQDYTKSRGPSPKRQGTRMAKAGLRAMRKTVKRSVAKGDSHATSTKKGVRAYDRASERTGTKLRIRSRPKLQLPSKKPRGGRKS